MRRLAPLTLAVLLAGAVHADPSQHKNIDLKDFDDDSMRDMDDANKDLQPVIGAKNKNQALSDVQVIQQVLKETEDYFSKKGDTEDAVKFARDGAISLEKVVAALNQNDFDTAAVAARAVSANCKTCHDVYKPLTK